MLGWIIRQASPECTSQSVAWEARQAIPGAHNEMSYPKIQWENTLDKRGTTESQGQWWHTQRESQSNDRGECKVKEQEQEHMTTHAAGS